MWPSTNLITSGNKLKTSSLVKSWALILTAGERFNAYEYYRKQLKKILNIRYPPPQKKKKNKTKKKTQKKNNKTKQKNPENNNKKTKTKQNNKQTKKIRNKSLYRICREKPLSIQILSVRWGLCGHIQRRDKDIRANKATRAYFIPNGSKLRGRPKTALPIVFNRDLALIQHPIRLHSSNDLAEITELAQDRKCWRGLTSQVEKAAEVLQIKNRDVARQWISKLVMRRGHIFIHFWPKSDLD